MESSRNLLMCCLLPVLLGGVGCNWGGPRQSSQAGSIPVAESPPRTVRFFNVTANRADRVVYLVDRSGSMVTHFDEVRMKLLKSVSQLSPSQQFHIVLFANGDLIESPPGRLVNATDAARVALVRFLESDRIRPSGGTVALPALKRAFEVLPRAHRAGDARSVVYLMTDGQFGGIGGSSRYKGLSGNEAVVQWLRDNNKDRRVRVFTCLFGEDVEAIKVMKQIARESGGTFKNITEDE